MLCSGPPDAASAATACDMRFSTTMCCIVDWSIAAKRQKNMRLSAAAKTLLIPFDAKCRTCFSPASGNTVKLKRIVA